MTNVSHLVGGVYKSATSYYYYVSRAPCHTVH